MDQDTIDPVFLETIEAMPDGIVVFNAERRLVATNAKMREIYAPAADRLQPGISMEQASRHIGEHCMGLTDPQALDAWVAERSALETDGSRTLELKLADGRWVSMRDTLLPNGWIVGVRRDVTQDKAAEAMREELQASRSRLRDFADSASDWFWEMDEELRFSYFSRRFSQVTGVPESALIGKTRQQTGIPNVDPEEWQAHLDALSEHRPFRNFVHPRVKEDGETVWLSINGRPYFDGAGTFRGFRGSGSDVTEREQAKLDLIAAKEASEQAARAKSEFLANMSHEIRTPMNGVLGMLELLRDSELGGEQREHVDTALSCAGDLLTLLNDVLDLSKIEAGRVEFEQVDMSMREVVEGICELHAETAHRKGLEIVPIVEPDAPMVRGDPTRVRQVVSNLVSNAIKFTETGEITVRVGLAAEQPNQLDRVCFDVEVTDSGIGIDEEAQGRIFESFTQADGSTTRRYGGTGLGLAISRFLVEQMGGELQVRSRPDIGSTFYFRAEFDRADGVGDVTAALAPFGKKRALIVDDTPANRLVLERRLARWGVRSVSVANAEDALRAVEFSFRHSMAFDIILLDAMMPDMDGFTLASKLALDRRLRATPRVMLTSLTCNGPDGWEAELGISQVLNKPIRSMQLHRCLCEQWMAPLPSPESPATTEVRATQSPASILVVEDNAVNRKVAVGMLSKLGFAADVACDGEEALAAMARKTYALVLMDCQMPVLDGYATTRAIRESNFAYKDVPIVALTASALKADADRCFESGMSDFLSKPVTKDALAQKLDIWLEEARDAG